MLEIAQTGAEELRNGVSKSEGSHLGSPYNKDFSIFEVQKDDLFWKCSKCQPIKLRAEPTKNSEQC